MSVTYTHPMSLPETIWEMLARTLSAEPKIDSTRNTPEALKDLYQRHLAVVLMNGNDPVGFIAVWPVEPGFVEIGSVWVDKDFRGQGLSHQIYDAVPGLPGIQNVIAFGVTTNPISVHVGERVGLTIVEDWTTPVSWRLSCGPCEVVAPADQPTCKKRNTSCWLRIIEK
ncbi:hypothetical protein COV05_04365 [Candidatus Uhrbacteria bacterium CG10_big_fil_rev_8_21_14_0_10_48_16]|uniref:N-acetyltransferase domain-containing protein n=1 Tax=Candidatus Uhrbacteria bacterium CG10_big_fil_rev_8_21_14_0_10_48_16 TaxID=1975038 RepID=A0A2M8LGJ6_9BACT|nr:MAG: hypothetical protein COV05_04365 [Candidatus Uhrbacteria bacterium CG10_big_fil_rev_8_21_14_0_10_48_16]